VNGLKTKLGDMTRCIRALGLLTANEVDAIASNVNRKIKTFVESVGETPIAKRQSLSTWIEDREALSLIR
jgi:hypothetical protein